MKVRTIFSLLLFTLTIARMEAQNIELWGTTQVGGTHDSGTIFKFNPCSGQLVFSYNFAGGPNDGKIPAGALFQANNGLLYGMTNVGGAYDKGILFSFDMASDSLTNLHSFGQIGDGAWPTGSLIQASDSLLYGMTDLGGADSLGTIFNYNIQTSAYTKLYDFKHGTDGSQPQNGAFVQVNDSLLYGTCGGGGGDSLIYYYGTIFSYNIRSGAETVLWRSGQGGGNDPEGPSGNLVKVSDSVYYGVSYRGGIIGTGTLFSFNVYTNSLQVKVNFNGNISTGIGLPAQGPVLVGNSTLYGLTLFSGNINYDGGLYKYDISADSFTILKNLYGPVTGGEPQDGLLLASNGLLYGVTDYSSSSNIDSGGTIFSYNINLDTVEAVHVFSSPGGNNPYGTPIEVKNTGSGCITMVNDLAGPFSFKIYPNPAGDFTYINFDPHLTGSELFIYDITGRIVSRCELAASPMLISTSALNAGIYLVEIKGKAGKVTRLLSKD